MTSLNHSFDILLAEEYGIQEAIIIHHFQHWIMVNKRKKKNFREGRTWTYQTLEEIAANFPYLSYKQVERIINRLVEKEVLLKGNFNKTTFDRTTWYAFKNEENFSISRFREMENPKEGNGSPEIGKPIPDTIPDPEKKDVAVDDDKSSSSFSSDSEWYKKKELLESLNCLKADQIQTILRIKNRTLEDYKNGIIYLKSKATDDPAKILYCAIRDQYEIPIQEEDKVEENKKFATDIIKSCTIPKNVIFETLSKHIEIGFSIGMKGVKEIKYNDKAFKELLKNELDIHSIKYHGQNPQMPS